MSFEWFFGVDAKEMKEKHSYMAPPPSILTNYLQNNAPVLYFFIQNINDEELYWKTLKNRMYLLTSESIEVKIAFPRFLDVLYKNRDFFKPKTVSDVLLLAEKCASPPLSNFLLVDLPLMVNDPVLVIKAISEMKFTRNKLFYNFQSEKGAVEKMFDLYLSYLDLDTGFYSQETWAFRIIVADILVSAINNYADSLVLVEQHVSYLHQKLLSLIEVAGKYTAVPLVRLMIHFHKETLARTHVEFATKRLSNLLYAVPPKSPSHAMAVSFVATCCGNFIPRKDIIRIPTLQGFASTWDITYIPKICCLDKNDEDALQKSVQCLSRTMCLSYQWSRISAVVLAGILKEYMPETGQHNRVQKWFKQFLDQIEVSKILQSHQNKYINRRRRLGEILNSSIFRTIPFVSDYYKKQNVSSLSFIDLVDAIKNSKNMILKFLPFSNKGDLLVFENEEGVYVQKVVRKITKARGKERRKKIRSGSVPVPLKLSNPLDDSNSIISHKGKKKAGKKKQ